LFPNEALGNFKAECASAHEHLKFLSNEVWEQKISAYNAKLALALFVPRIRTDHTNHTFAANNFTVTANFLY